MEITETREIPATHQRELKQCIGSQEIPKKVKDIYWKIKVIADRSGTPLKKQQFCLIVYLADVLAPKTGEQVSENEEPEPDSGKNKDKGKESGDKKGTGQSDKKVTGTAKK